MRVPRRCLPGLLGASVVLLPMLSAYGQALPVGVVQTPPVETPTPSSSTPSDEVSALATGVYARVGATATSFIPDGLTFRQTNVPRDTPRAMAPGKDLVLGSILPGVTLGLGIDTSWFYIRVGLDVLTPATAVRPDLDNIHLSTIAWGSFGGRLVLGHFALLAGVRLGAMIVGLSHQIDPSRAASYDAISGIYATDIGVEWRPARWFQLDATLGQDFGSLLSTTASLCASFGWTRSPNPR